MKTMYRSHWKLWASALLAVGMLALPAAAQVDPVATAKAVSTAFAQVAEKASPAVVFIEVDAEANTQQMPQGMDPGDLFERFFGPGMPNGPWRQLPQGRGEQQNEQQNEQQSNRLVPYGQGTGFIITPDGYIITNHHLVGDAKRVRVKLSDGREFEAKIIGSDADTEVALVKIEGDALPTLPLGDLMNEPDNSWRIPAPKDFIRMNRLLDEELKKRHLRDGIMLLGMDGSNWANTEQGEWFYDVAAEGGCDYFDGASFHTYGQSFTCPTINDFILSRRQALDTFGGADKPLMITEFGCFGPSRGGIFTMTDNDKFDYGLFLARFAVE